MKTKICLMKTLNINIYMAAKKLYDLGEYKKSLTYFKKISNYKDVYKYIIDIESLINIE